MIKNVSGMVVFFAAFVVFWFWFAYKILTPKMAEEKFHVVFELILVVAVIIFAVFVLYFFNGAISALLEYIF